MSKQQPVFVGVDDGHYAVKVVTEDGRMFSVPSRAKSGRHLISIQSIADDGVDAAIYETDEGAVYTVHEHLSDFEDTRFKDYPVSPLNRVLVHHALRKAGFGGQSVNIATGLPVSYYYVGNEPNTALIDGKTDNIRKGVSCNTGDCALVATNVVTTEAIAAYFDQIMDMDGNPTAVYEEGRDTSVGIIDIGGKTTDCAVILPGGQNVDTMRSGSSDVGVLSLNDRVRAALMTHFNFDQVPSRHIEQAVSKGVIKVYGKDEPVKGLVEKAKLELADQIMSIVRSKIGSGKDLDWVLFVGGGSIVMRDQLEKHFPHARFPDHPEYANARGMLKIAKYVFGEPQ